MTYIFIFRPLILRQNSVLEGQVQRPLYAEGALIFYVFGETTDGFLDGGRRPEGIVQHQTCQGEKKSAN